MTNVQKFEAACRQFDGILTAKVVYEGSAKEGGEPCLIEVTPIHAKLLPYYVTPAAVVPLWPNLYQVLQELEKLKFYCTSDIAFPVLELVTLTPKEVHNIVPEGLTKIAGGGVEVISGLDFAADAITPLLDVQAKLNKRIDVYVSALTKGSFGVVAIVRSTPEDYKAAHTGDDLYAAFKYVAQALTPSPEPQDSEPAKNPALDWCTQDSDGRGGVDITPSSEHEDSEYPLILIETFSNMEDSEGSHVNYLGVDQAEELAQNLTEWAKYHRARLAK